MIDKNEINKLEKIGSDVHPALEQAVLEGWILNYTEGFSKRGNSVLPQTEGTDLLVQVQNCETWYEKRGQTPIFKMTKAAPKGLKELLEKCGYTDEASTDVMTVLPENPVFQEKMESVVEPEETGVIMTSSPDEAWLKCYFEYENRTDPKTMDIVRRQFALVDKNENLSAIYCRIQMWGKDVAVASVVIEDGVMFLLNVVVNPDCRGKGYGKILVKQILEAACDIGAEKLCLQVVASNEVAKNMYKSFGFEVQYSYWYMCKSIV